ncbi:MAG: hypothetical protein JKX73_03815 [Flavobacteriales bacterium]|nr:hypothetical protein [Flavobacteriales bacterium]
MYRRLLTYLVILGSVSAYAQNPVTDSTKTDPVSIETLDESDDESKGEAIDSSGITDMGVAVAPSIMNFRTTPGKSETRYLTITNDTYKQQNFRITFADFDLNDHGSASQLPFGEQHEYGLTRWIVADQTFVKLKPGEAKKIGITVNLPDVPEAYRAAWGLMMVDLEKERDYIVPPKSGDNISMGIIPTYGFGIFIYQNPPNTTINKVEITKFDFTYDDKNRYVNIAVKNVGDGIGFCVVYVELSNLNTGYQERLPLKRITVLPGQSRELDFAFPGDTPKGEYSIMGVLDFGSDTEMEAAEMEINVQ